MITLAPLRRAVRGTLRALPAILFDFDGVFTDNSVVVSETGAESVRCSRADGIGLSSLRKTGVTVGIVSSEVNEVVQRRADKLGVPCRHGCESKESAARELLAGTGVRLEDIGFVGNDVNDLPIMRRVAVPIAVSDAHPLVRKVAVITLRQPGGYGAVREICDLIVAARDSAAR